MTSHHHRTLRSLLSTRGRAKFHAQVTVHDIINVPFIEGHFFLRWRFQHAQSVHEEDVLLRNKKKELESSASGGTVEGGAPDDREDASQVPGQSSVNISSSSSSHSRSSSGHQLRVRNDNYGGYHAPESPVVSTRREDVEIPDIFATTARGRTDWYQLHRDHRLRFQQRMDVDLEIPVVRETKELDICELKLEVWRDVPATEHQQRTKDILGAVYIDLSAYATTGAVTRRHLLKKSKVNAIMRVTVDLQQFDGETDYITPKLPDGQLMGGVAGLLERESAIHTPVRLPSRSANQSSKSLQSLVGKDKSNDPAPHRDLSIMGSDDSQVPSTNTEAIINALFNPYPSSSISPSPFTFYPQRNGNLAVPPAGQPSRISSTKSAPTTSATVIGGEKEKQGLGNGSSSVSFQLVQAVEAFAHHHSRPKSLARARRDLSSNGGPGSDGGQSSTSTKSRSKWWKIVHQTTAALHQEDSASVSSRSGTPVQSDAAHSNPRLRTKSSPTKARSSMSSGRTLASVSTSLSVNGTATLVRSESGATTTTTDGRGSTFSDGDAEDPGVREYREDGENGDGDEGSEPLTPRATRPRRRTLTRAYDERTITNATVKQRGVLGPPPSIAVTDYADV